MDYTHKKTPFNKGVFLFHGYEIISLITKK